MSAKRFSLSVLSIGLGLGMVFGLIYFAIAASQIDIEGPPGSEYFGTTVTVLPNGNIVVTDPSYDAGDAADVGAVYLYDGASGGLISMLTGSTAGDGVGSDGVTVLANGNYVVSNPSWDNGNETDAGAVTWGGGTSGVTGTVSAANSLVGSTANDLIGYVSWDTSGVMVLANGNYLVRSPYWHNGMATAAGAVTWGNGETGVIGPVSAANSLVGSTAYNSVGNVTVLANGNYVVSSPGWDNGAIENAGAATWGDGTTGVTGTISTANSLVGNMADDTIGIGVTALTNGNYVVRSPNWNFDNWNGNAGAVTWGDGASGITGTVSAANSLVGTYYHDEVGSYVIELTNGNYVVSSPYWRNYGSDDAGAVTWGDGMHGVTGTVTAANSLVGSNYDDRVGWNVIPLANGNYLSVDWLWDNGAATDAGAVTWGNGMRGVTGTVSMSNSLVGSTAYDRVGDYPGITALANGNYVVSSPWWDNGAAANAGAATWGDGTSGVSGEISAANSLVGITVDDQVGYFAIIELSNSNYVVSSPYWDDGAAADAGAVTWGDGSTGVTGTVSAANSLVGNMADDMIGIGVTALSNGNYVVSSPDWDNGAAVAAGAATWGDGGNGVTGTVSTANSLVGSTAIDRVGDYPGITALSNGNYVVSSRFWDNGAIEDVGAVIWGDGESGVTGTISTANSLVGTSFGDEVGSYVIALTDGNYVVSSRFWDNGAATNAGAVTWGDGTSGTTGEVSAANSLVGTSFGDEVGGTLDALTDGNYVVSSSSWDNGAAADAGAVTWGYGGTGTIGSITSENSVLGEAPYGGFYLNHAYDDLNRQLVVGRPWDKVVTLFRLNDPPVAGAGSDQTVKSLSTVTLDGRASHDPDGNLPLAYGWTQSGGTVITLSNTTAVSPTFMAPAVVIQTSVLTFTLVVTDSLGMPSLPDQVVIIVEPYPVLLPVISKQDIP